MLINEVTHSNFNPLLVKFWKSCDKDMLTRFFTLGECRLASGMFNNWLYHDAHLGRGEIVDIGYITKSGSYKKGWFETDFIQHEYDDMHPSDFPKMQEQGLDPKKDTDRLAYITNNGLDQKFKMIPHSWVEIRTRNGYEVIDPSGFYIDGVSGQFDKLVKDKSNLSSRYHYFS